MVATFRQVIPPQVTFEGHWSRNTHPRSFPGEAARAHFGDVIGASHTAQYRVWQEGRVASAGLRRLADDGATTALEKELKAEVTRELFADFCD